MILPSRLREGLGEGMSGALDSPSPNPPASGRGAEPERT